MTATLHLTTKASSSTVLRSIAYTRTKYAQAPSPRQG